jgi:acyl-CoA thioesterase FadM
VATGRYVLVCVRQGDFKPVPVPAELKSRIVGFLETGKDSTEPTVRR